MLFASIKQFTKLIFMLSPSSFSLGQLCKTFQSLFDILKLHSRWMNLMRGIDLKKIAEKMNAASGAELKHNRPWRPPHLPLRSSPPPHRRTAESPLRRHNPTDG